jgi:hypothetical protein
MADRSRNRNGDEDDKFPDYPIPQLPDSPVTRLPDYPIIE